MSDLERPDVDSSTEAYARRFSGSVGRWFLETQASLALELLAPLPVGATILDVGGGHAQLVPGLVKAGFDVLVFGSPGASLDRLEPWRGRAQCRVATGDLRRLPFADRSFDAAISFRILPHLSRWAELIGELCRVSAGPVVVDYPARRSINVVSHRLFGLKRRIEGDTRPYHLFTHTEVGEALAAAGFEVDARRPQYLLPMVLYRFLRSAAAARGAESLARGLGLTKWFGSPVIARARPTAPPARDAPARSA